MVVRQPRARAGRREDRPDRGPGGLRVPVLAGCPRASANTSERSRPCSTGTSGRRALATSPRWPSRLAAHGLRAPLLVMQSSGGVVPASAAAEIALGILDSGPTAGLTGAAALAAANGHRNVVATDMGGTSFDIGLVVDGQPIVADESVIDQYTYRLPHLDVRTTACGGGTIARRDPQTGALRVGPDSAGAEPGPACYGRGGTQATITDADVVLGLLRPGQLPGRPHAAGRERFRGRGRAAGRFPGPGAGGDRGRPDQRQQPACRDPDPPADPGTRPRPARLRPVLLRRRRARCTRSVTRPR